MKRPAEPIVGSVPCTWAAYARCFEFEINWCSQFLPKAADEGELRAAVAKAVAELPSKDPKMAGKPDAMRQRIAQGHIDQFDWLTLDHERTLFPPNGYARTTG